MNSESSAAGNEVVAAAENPGEAMHAELTAEQADCVAYAGICHLHGPRGTLLVQRGLGRQVGKGKHSRRKDAHGHEGEHGAGQGDSAIPERAG